MKNPKLEAGKILNTHGVRGELKVESWLDDPALFGALSSLEVNGVVYPIQSARTHGRFALVKLEGIDSIDDALPLKNKVALTPREDIPLEEGAHFVADLIGLRAIDADTGAELGIVQDILEYPAQDLYVIHGPERDYLVPDVPEFIREIDEGAGCIRVHLLEGM